MKGKKLSLASLKVWNAVADAEFDSSKTNEDKLAPLKVWEAVVRALKQNRPNHD